MSIWLRAYQEESTTSRLISEVKSVWAWPVLGLATTWEHQVLQPLFFVFVCLFDPQGAPTTHQGRVCATQPTHHTTTATTTHGLSRQGTHSTNGHNNKCVVGAAKDTSARCCTKAKMARAPPHPLLQQQHHHPTTTTTRHKVV